MTTMDANNWSVKYRPKNLQQFIGQPLATALVRKMLEDGKIPRTILISGETGHGKTSLGRIIATEINNGIPWNTNSDIVDINAGAEGGIDKIRSIADIAANMPQFGNYRVFIIDESHRLSGAARNAALKLTEEPPGKSIFILLTNYPDELPSELLGRCFHIKLKPIAPKDLLPYLAFIGRQENAFQPPQNHAEIYRWCSEVAGGQPRQAIQFFQMCAMLEGKASTKDILNEVQMTYGEEPEVSAVKIMCGVYSLKSDIVVQVMQRVKDPSSVIRNALYINSSMIEILTGNAKWTSVHYKKVEGWLRQNKVDPPSLRNVFSIHKDLAKLLDHSGFSTASKNAMIVATIGERIELLIEGK